jgi:hypothetical protein
MDYTYRDMLIKQGALDKIVEIAKDTTSEKLISACC